MRRHRTTARGILLAALLGLTAGQAAALPDPGYLPQKARAGAATRSASTGDRIIFPVLGRSRYGNSFGAPRYSGRHEGIDITAPRRALALAVEPGRVRFHVTSSAAGCMLYLHGRSGTTWLYIHLNNDLGTTNDNRGRCVPGTAYAPGLRNGARVVAGEPIGFVGDSGDADGIEPHLHFEMHPNDGRAANPFDHLNRAWRLLFAAPRQGEHALWLKGSVLAQQAQALRVNVQSLGVRTTGLRLNGISRPVSLAVSPVTIIETALGRLAGRDRATVWTQIAPVTLEAQLGKPGAL
ncbi:MAG: M23 family metallopeptidase, partial [Actinomycetota bacterium]|nr:M23 family metallopeptidase [Actinomycetota bacterium]